MLFLYYIEVYSNKFPYIKALLSYKYFSLFLFKDTFIIDFEKQSHFFLFGLQHPLFSEVISLRFIYLFFFRNRQRKIFSVIR